MKVLIRQARIVSPPSPYHGKIQDILIRDGSIVSVADAIDEEADQVIGAAGLSVSPGWTDCFAAFADPGYEFRETLATGAAAAEAGGFTDVLLIPNTKPAIDNKSQVEYITRAAGLSVNLHAIGAITKNTEGKELAEMYDMRQSGAVAFGDGTNPVQSPGILLKALQYVKAFDGVIIQVPDDKSIGAQGLMNEGLTSTRMGLPGKPAIAEELMIARDIELLKYTGSRLHISGVSTKKGIELIAAAKEAGLDITCSVTPYHLSFCEEDLVSYDTNLKVNPPLRTQEDMLALRKALAEGKVDCIASHHQPQDWDSKACEFEYAKPGMIGLETVFGAVGQIMTEEMGTEQLVQCLSVNPRNIFGLPVPVIKEGEAACITLFDAEETYIFDQSMIKSRSKNSAFTGKKMKGKVKGIINGNKTVLL